MCTFISPIFKLNTLPALSGYNALVSQLVLSKCISVAIARCVHLSTPRHFAMKQDRERKNSVFLISAFGNQIDNSS